jgi:hypothetical protein
MGTGGGLVVIDFTARGNSAYFRETGWSGQEPDRVWAIGPRAVLRVPLQTSVVSSVLEVELGPCHAPPLVSGQIVRIRVNDRAIGWARLDTQVMIRCEIDVSLARADGVQVIEFDFPGFYRPEILGRSKDGRPLSAWFYFARLYTTDMFRPGPHFPSSGPRIEVIGLRPPFAEPAAGHAARAPEIYTFGSAGTAEKYLRDGWHHDGTASTLLAAAASRIALPAPATPGPYLLRLDLRPTTDPRGQRDILLTLDRIAIGHFRPGDEPSSWVAPLPRELTEGRDTLDFTLLCSALAPGGDSAVPAPAIALERVSIVPRPASFSDRRMPGDGDRIPAAAVRRLQPDGAAARPSAIEAAPGIDVATLARGIDVATLARGIDVATLARGFENLGTNAEFGIVQRNLGVEVVNLFRFCDVPVADLSRALADDLAALGDPAHFAIAPAGEAAHVLTLPAYNMRWPVASGADDDASMRAHATAIGYLRRKFFEGLRSGRKIYVLARQRPIPVSQAVALLMDLHRHGPAAVLCVEQNERRAGEIEVLMPGLMRGYLERFAPETDPAAVDVPGWSRLIANAAQTYREAKGAA